MYTQYTAGLEDAQPMHSAPRPTCSKLIHRLGTHFVDTHLTTATTPPYVGPTAPADVGQGCNIMGFSRSYSFQ